MLSEERNRDLVDTRPGMPAGELLRRYWQPIALSDEAAPGRRVPVTIMHEDLTLFRNADGAAGLAPEYPCCETGGVIFAYLGPGDPPVLAPLEIFSAPPEHRAAIKVLQECNYLQANEGNLDPVHQSFLHGFRGAGKAAADSRVPDSIGGTTATNLELYAANVSPGVDQENTRFGIQAFISRPVPDGGTFLKIYNFVMPNYAIVPGGAGADGYSINWHVPIDDTNHWKFVLIFNRAKTIDRAALEGSVFPEFESPFRPKRNKSNRYLQDRDDMASGASGWLSGLGSCFVDHDSCAHEMQGPIQDRTREHLAQSDKIIVRMRRLMLDAIGDIRKHKDPRGVIRGDADNWAEDLRVVSEYFPASENWRETWPARAASRLRDRPESSTVKAGG